MSKRLGTKGLDILLLTLPKSYTCKCCKIFPLNWGKRKKEYLRLLIKILKGKWRTVVNFKSKN